MDRRKATEPLELPAGCGSKLAIFIGVTVIAVPWWAGVLYFFGWLT